MPISYVNETCPFCQGGVVGVRRCADGETLVLMCDECEAVWQDPSDTSLGAVLFPDSASWVVAVGGADRRLAGGGSGWATAEEIRRRGWTRWVCGESGG